MPALLVPVDRLARWVQNFAARHDGCALAVGSGTLTGEAPDGSTFAAALPFGRVYDGPALVESFTAAAGPPRDWGVLLVRKGGFAVARLHGSSPVVSKVGQRHVQGRTKAGGQSQQRFARRRDNQARAAYQAAADHAARVLGGVPVLVCGGDHAAVHAVLDDPRLDGLAAVVVPPWLAVPDPRRAVLEQALADAGSVRMTVTNA
ncbi:MAG TPA: acVLRF1 family peptidyl-tRNA hydrolase [Marmoricola sp.]|nr:acVLRF1 family peptidyl-tRNA hydrolase [Marmoricola sp.]